MNNTVINETIKAIKDLKIQGATNVCKESILALGIWTKDNSWNINQFRQVVEIVSHARPTEPLTRNCLNWLLDIAKNKQGEPLLNDAEKIINKIQKSKDDIVNSGLTLIKNQMTILTHCHSSTVTGILKKANKDGVNFKVYLTETRPKFQGHITAKELVSEGIDATMIIDSQAAYIVSKEDKIEIDLILIGADAIGSGGSAVNKVGSYGISLSAKISNTPFYVTASVLKYSTTEIKIEVRSSEEVWKDHPENLKILNPAFDKIPAKNITGFVTEFGIFQPEKIKALVTKHYPWIFNNHL